MNRGENSAVKLFQGKVYPSDQERNPYLLLPFEVPFGIKAIEIEYDYTGEGNVLDLGAFDPRGHEFLSALGFRGWSGSARRHVIIAERQATPGYLPGPILPGIWHVILGLYKIKPEGCAYEVKVRLHTEPVDVLLENNPLETRFLPTLPGGITKPGWLKGDLHCHTHHSEAQGSVKDLVCAAEKKGLDFLAITDHNTISHWRELAEQRTKLILIPGEEVTTYRGHANVWGWGGWLDFRFTDAAAVEKVYAQAHAEGRLFSVNHPKPGGPPWEYGFEVPFDCLEVWHKLWTLGNETSLHLWDWLLRHGRQVVAVGGSDTHPIFLPEGVMVEWLGLPTTWVMAEERSCEAVLNGIRKGRVSISACFHGPFISLSFHTCGERIQQGGIVPPPGRGECEVEVEGGEGLELFLVSRRGVFEKQRVRSGHWVEAIEVDLEQEAFVRAELRAPVPILSDIKWPVVAITNPIWYNFWRRR